MAPNQQGTHGLPRFDKIIGTGPGQIAPGSTILPTMLYFSTAPFEEAADRDGAQLHRLRRRWSHTGTWSTLRGGIQADG
jgi:hypothetical protein